MSNMNLGKLLLMACILLWFKQSSIAQCNCNENWGYLPNMPQVDKNNSIMTMEACIDSSITDKILATKLKNSTNDFLKSRYNAQNPKSTLEQAVDIYGAAMGKINISDFKNQVSLLYKRENNNDNYSAVLFSIACQMVKGRIKSEQLIQGSTLFTLDVAKDSIETLNKKMKTLEDNHKQEVRKSKKNLILSLAILLPVLLLGFGLFFFENRTNKRSKNTILNLKKLIDESLQTGSKSQEIVESHHLTILNGLKDVIRDKENTIAKLQLQLNSQRSDPDTSKAIGKTIAKNNYLFATPPQGKSFFRVNTELLPTETYYVISFEEGKQTGTFTLVDDNATREHAFSLVDVLKDACELKGVGRPQVSQSISITPGDVEFMNGYWVITKLMVLNW